MLFPDYGMRVVYTPLSIQKTSIRNGIPNLLLPFLPPKTRREANKLDRLTPLQNYSASLVQTVRANIREKGERRWRLRSK
jgi:hypothetical protein